MKKFQDAEKEAGGDEKLIFKFAWPYIVLQFCTNSVQIWEDVLTWGGGDIFVQILT